MLLSHARIWTAVDRLAAANGLTPSGLARRAGLDATTFNKSKRHGPDGRPRWPSTESIAKILEATGGSLEALLGTQSGGSLPLLGLAQAGAGGYFSDGGFPTGVGWDEVPFPGAPDNIAYALSISGDSMLPLYREGDIIVVSPAADCRAGDRVVVKTVEGEVMAKVLQKIDATAIELASLNPSHPDRVLQRSEVEWMARVLWASQ